MALKGLAANPSIKTFSKRKQLEQNLEHVTQEMYRRNKELAETNRTLSLLRSIDSLVLESHDTIKALCSQITAAINTGTEYPFVALLGQSNSRSGRLEIYGWSASQPIKIRPELLPELKPSSRHNWFRKKDRSKFLSLLHLKGEELSNYLGCTTDEAEELKKSLGLKSVYVVKLVAREKLVGVMVVGSFNPVEEFHAAETNLLERLSEAVGIALDNKLLFEENQQVLKQLQKANSRLRELDKTKDEFISMASHQLRTPLTTVKGYLSMILEGDEGPVKKDQKEMIQLAFDGANRMVYLIADLLNVSRLQSGKFVIDNKPTDLASVVETELGQLKEQAATRQIELVYKKPDHFPVLNLDETKIRQVVMNFLDNAIYYTPKGGKVEAGLTATDSTISYTVTDTGVGVPKEVQHHLFSKFYRADNARKMRPDGTGLGLFMAKKVIVAQGGAIIFKSTEGKGSVFGFSFPRKSMELKGEKAVVTDAPKEPELPPSLPPAQVKTAPKPKKATKPKA